MIAFVLVKQSTNSDAASTGPMKSSSNFMKQYLVKSGIKRTLLCILYVTQSNLIDFVKTWLNL